MNDLNIHINATTPKELIALAIAFFEGWNDDDSVVEVEWAGYDAATQRVIIVLDVNNPYQLVRGAKQVYSFASPEDYEELS